MPETDGLTIALLGPPVIEVDGLPLKVDTRKATALLAYLVVTARPMSRDAIASLLWPESDPERARAALRRTLSTVRTALDGRWLSTNRELVSLDDDGVRFDLADLRAAVAECETHEHAKSGTCARCVPLLEAAETLVRGSFMEGFVLRGSVEFDDWQQLLDGTVRREHAAILDRLCDAHVETGDLARALATAERRLALDPLHEPAHRNVIRLLALTGDRSTALEQYRECVRALDRELGVRPLDETTDLYHSILEGTFATRSPLVAATSVASDDLPISRYDLVGREQPFGALCAALDGLEQDGRVVALVGEAGIGKTRLAQEFAAHAAAQERVIASARAFPDERELAFGVAIELARAALSAHPTSTDAWWRTEAARVLPELGPAPPNTVETPGAQARLFEALTELLIEGVHSPLPGVLIVDDLHWADESSLALVSYLVNRLRHRPVFLVVSWRPEEVNVRHPVVRLLSDAQRSGSGQVITLDRLSEPDLEQLISAAGQRQVPARELHRRTGGLPFFVVEYLDALNAGSADDTGWAVPVGVRDLLERRLGSLGELATQVAAAAAVLGRPFDADILCETSGRTQEETVGAIEELLRSGLLVESDGDYDFRHEQARDLAYDALTFARRRLLHARAAAALELRGRREEQSALIAYHLSQSGAELDAADLYETAGDRARSLFANSEALTHYRSALALGSRHVARLHEAIGDLLTLAGAYGDALASYEAAAAHADTEELPEIEHRLGQLHLRRGAWELADAALASALERLNGSQRARALADRSLAAHRTGDHAAAATLAESALGFAREADDRPALAQAHNLLGMLASQRGESGATDHLSRSLDLAVSASDRDAEIAARNNLALALARDGDPEAALRQLRLALEVCTTIGDRHREAALRNNLADLLHAMGRQAESMAELKLAVAIFAEVGEAGKLEPEVWTLSAW